MRRDEMSRLAKTYHLDLVYLFGSAARGDMRAESDIDIAFRAIQHLDANDRLMLEQDLKRVLNVSGHTIDLVDIRTAPPLLTSLISREGRKLYGSPRADDSFYRSSLKRFIDAKPIFDATADYVNSSLALQTAHPPKI